MKRGDLVRVALPGSYGKVRPALVIQSDIFDMHPSITLLPLTGDLRAVPAVRITLQPTTGNGLQKTSQVMVDKAHTARREKIGEPFGRVSNKELSEITRALAVFLGII